MAQHQFGSGTTAKSTPNDELLKAIEQALAGKWDAAHQMIQDMHL